MTTHSSATALPPGPRMPRALQTAIWFREAQWMLAQSAARFGETFTLLILHEGTWVMLSNPEHVKQVFTGDPKVFHAGDTALSAELRMLGELYRPDAAFLPVGATEPGLEFMPPDEAAIALQWIGARTAIPMHFPPGSGADRAFADAVAARGLDAHVEFMAPGATLEIANSPTTYEKEP